MDSIQYNLADGIGWLTLNRPQQRNAIDADMRQKLAHTISQIQQDDATRVLVITGAGGAFCSGGDIRGMQDTSVEGARRRLVDLHAWLEPLFNLDRPVIAAVDGVAFGAGFGLALAADMVIATPRTKFCAAFMRLGLIPDFGLLYTLPRIVGRQKAKELVFSAREVDADEAVQLGIAMEIQPPERLRERVGKLAASLANGSPLALSIAKRALNVSLDNNLAAALEIEISGQVVARSSDYHRDSINRFLNKQSLQFEWPKD